MKMTTEQPLDPTLERAFDAIRTAPERAPQAIADGRAAFLAEARAARERAVIAARMARLRRWRITLSLFIATLTGSVGVVYAAQSSLPDSPVLYQVKLVSEDLRYALASTPDQQRDLLAQFSQRRNVELRAAPAMSPGAARAQARLAAHEAALEALDKQRAQQAPHEITPTPTRAATATVARSTATAQPTLTPTPPPAATPMPPTVPPATTVATLPTATAEVATAAPTQPPTQPAPTPAPPPARTPNPTRIALRSTAIAEATRLAAVPTISIATRQAFATRISQVTPPPPLPTGNPALPPQGTPSPLPPAPTPTPILDIRRTVQAIIATVTALPEPLPLATRAALATAITEARATRQAIASTPTTPPPPLPPQEVTPAETPAAPPPSPPPSPSPESRRRP